VDAVLAAAARFVTVDGFCPRAFEEKSTASRAATVLFGCDKISRQISDQYLGDAAVTVLTRCRAEIVEKKPEAD